jgi:glutathione S-transferase
MILRSSPTSPFGRKVVLAAAILGLSDAIEVVAADTNNPDEALLRQNPLAKIPTLVLEDGRALYDSGVILEYLDSRVGGGKIIPNGEGRFIALTRQALADGIMDAALLQVYEQRYREPEIRSAKWVERQAGKVARGLAAAEADPPAAGSRGVGEIALACALGYLDLRFAGAWRADHSALVVWLDSFAAAVPAFAATRVKG